MSKEVLYGDTLYDYDDFIEPPSTAWGLKFLKRNFGVTIPKKRFYDNPWILANTRFDTVDEFLAAFNSGFMTEEYLNMPLRPAYVAKIKEAAKKRRQGIGTARPPYLADATLEKLDRNGLLPAFKGGVHHLPLGQKTKRDICLELGFEQELDDHPKHIFHVSRATGLRAIGYVGHREWNQMTHYREYFPGGIPENVVLVGSFRHAVDTSLQPAQRAA